MEAKPVSRYTTAARINHWITAVSLVLLALSGMALFHPSLYFLTALFGGGQMTRILHPWIGVVLAISFTGLFIRFFVLNARGEYAGVAMYHAGETKFAVCTENGAETPELEPLLPGSPESGTVP